MKSQRRVLLLDDDPLFLTETAGLLRTKSYLVRTLLSPKRLLFFLPRFQPDLLLLDFEMTEANGIELLRLVRESSFGMNLPIVLFTSRNEPIILKHAFAGGIDDFVRKPLILSEFFLRLDAILRRSQPKRLFMRLENLENWQSSKTLPGRGLLFWRPGYKDLDMEKAQFRQKLEKITVRWLHSFRDHVLACEKTLRISDLPIVAIQPEMLFLPLPKRTAGLLWMDYLEKQARALQRYCHHIQADSARSFTDPKKASTGIFLRLLSGMQEIPPSHLAHSIRIALELEESRKPFAVLPI